MASQDSRIVGFADFLAGQKDDADVDFFTCSSPSWLIQEALKLLPERRAYLQHQKDLDLFNTQIKLLSERMREKSLVQMLAVQMQPALSRAAGLEPDPATCMRFLPVFPLCQLTATSQMPLVELYGKQGFIARGIPPYAFRDPLGTPEDPYYVYDVRFVPLGEVDAQEFEFLGVSETMGLCRHIGLNKLPLDAYELYALKPRIVGTKRKLVPSIYVGRSGAAPKLDFVSRDRIPEGVLVPVRRRMEGE